MRPGPPADRDEEPFAAESPRPSVESLFRTREFELSLTEEEYKRHSPVAPTCVNSESILRRLAGGAEDCPAFRPGGEESEIFNLPFLAILGWALVIVAVAGLYRLYGLWRVRRRLRQMRAQGLLPSSPPPRRPAERRAKRSPARTRPRPRRYAG